ncbi:MAG: class I SAM-dependent methyltransferase [Anaerolineae bacterium]|nr:class I SAM-dependent methyltransferase [Anaerolineae bacterium]
MSRQPSDPVSILFMRRARLFPGARVLLLNAHDPAVARWAIDTVGPGGHVLALPATYHALNMLARVPNLDVSGSVYPAPDISGPDASGPDTHGPVDVALLRIPKGREHVRAYVWSAARMLQPGSSLYLAGLNSTGAKTALKDTAAVFGSAPVLGHKSSCRIALATRPDTVAIPPSWCDPAPWQPQTRVISRPEADYTIITMPGVFSWDHLDDGTALLLDQLAGHSLIQPDDRVLDIGCGYGIIGLVAAHMGAQVTLVDDSLLAVRCARDSAAANDLSARCTVLPSDITSAISGGARKNRPLFDVVLSNPPFHKGVDVTTSITQHIVRESFDALRRGGRLWIVANQFLPYERMMQQQFGNVSLIADDGRYRVLESTR